MRRLAKTTTIVASGTVLSLTTLVLFTPILSAQAEVVVRISKSQQRLAVTVDGAELYRWPVSTGRSGLETPSGAFRPIRLERTWYSSKYDGSPMPYSIFFHRGYAVHGTYERRHLGHAVSHGCVRLLPANAATLFSLVRREGKGNAQIVVTNGPLPPATDGAKIADAHKPRPAREIAAKVVTHAAEPEISVPLPAPIKPQFAVATPPAKTVAVIPQLGPVKQAARVPAPQPRLVRPRAAAPHLVHGRSNDNFVTAGDEAAVLRGREAWLRSLDRKYGISH